MSIVTFTECSRLMGYKSRSTLYAPKKNQLLEDYVVHCAGKDYLDLNSIGKQKLLDYIPTIVQWRQGNVTDRELYR